VQRDLLEHPLLFEPDLDQAAGQACGIDRHVKLAQKMRQGANVVQVAVGHQDGAQQVFPLTQIVPVGQDIIHARHIRLGEHDPRVDDNDVAAILDAGHVLANFPQAAQGHDSKFRIQCILSFIFLLRAGFPTRPVRC
jgi:hypothetical protein